MVSATASAKSCGGMLTKPSPFTLRIRTATNLVSLWDQVCFDPDHLLSFVNSFAIIFQMPYIRLGKGDSMQHL